MYIKCNILFIPILAHLKYTLQI